MAKSVPLSNRFEASLGNLCFLDVLLMLSGLKIADSIIKFFVVSTTSLFKPPITPASEIAFFESAITKSLSDKFLMT